ncbi:MAG: DMT family transporter [Deltaproteobacteria bacterium]|nr:DMT family transporter [Deltaproteobacteria bacterium]
MNPSTLFAILLTTLVGIAIVAQGSVNAQLLRNTNLWLLLTIGNLVCLVSSLVGYGVTRTQAGLMTELSQIPLRVIIPGISGLVITAGMPLAIGRIGVPSAVTLVIAVQIVAGLAWDQVSGTGSPLSAMRVGGAALVFVGSFLVVRG